MNLRRLHRLNALALGVFICAHLANHVAALIGPQSHIAVMQTLRNAYRPYPVEALIVALFALQVILGIVLMAKRGRPAGRWAWAQVISGTVLALFLLQHLGAVVFMRLTSELDTNFHWAASVVHADPVRWYFIPYYWLGMTALFVHVAAALHFRKIGTPMLQGAIAGFGAALAGLIVTALSGGLHDFRLPAAYLAYLSGMYGL